MHRGDLLHPNRVDTVHATDHALRILLQVQLVVGQNLEEEVQLVISHGLDDEATVEAEEKEAAAGTRAFASLKDHVTIVLGAETV